MAEGLCFIMFFLISASSSFVFSFLGNFASETELSLLAFNNYSFFCLKTSAREDA